jgi:hypothetical protein
VAFEVDPSNPMPAARRDVLARCGVAAATEWAPYFNEHEHYNASQAALVDLFACIDALERRVAELEAMARSFV